MATRGPRVLDLDNLWPPNIPVKRVLLGAALLLVVLLGFSMLYTIEPEEVGVILTFGKLTDQTPPGFHFKWPRPIQTVIKVPVLRQLKQEFGFRTASPGVRTQYQDALVLDESLMLTGDLNVAVVEWTTQYRVSDPKLFLFHVRNIDETFRDMNEAVMREVVGDRSVNEVLTIGRTEIATAVETRLQTLCDQYESGLKVIQVVLQDVNPPDEVKASFNEVNQAQQERERMINEARAEYNRVVPRAEGEALQAIQQAEGYATERVNRAEGEAARFKAVLAAYQRAPEVTRRRLYLETMQEIYPKVKNKIVLDGKLKGILPLLPVAQGGGQ